MADSVAAKPAKPAKPATPAKAAEPIAFTPEGEPYVAGVADLSPIQGTYVHQPPAPMSSGEKIVLGLITTAAVAGAGVLAYFGIKAEKERAEEVKAEDEKRKQLRWDTEKWFEDKRKDGFVVIETSGGEYMALPAEAYAKSEIRKQDA